MVVTPRAPRAAGLLQDEKVLTIQRLQAHAHANAAQAGADDDDLVIGVER